MENQFYLQHQNDKESKLFETKKKIREIKISPIFCINLVYSCSKTSNISICIPNRRKIIHICRAWFDIVMASTSRTAFYPFIYIYFTFIFAFFLCSMIGSIFVLRKSFNPIHIVPHIKFWWRQLKLKSRHKPTKSIKVIENYVSSFEYKKTFMCFINICSLGRHTSKLF